MRIISFAWTTPALLAGAKTMTRRMWNDDYASRLRAGELIAAWDKSPRTGRGRQVATIRLTKAPYLEDTVTIAPTDYDREGFRWIEVNGTDEDRARVREIWGQWILEPTWLWVVEFELVSIVAAAAPSLGSGDAAAVPTAIGGDLR